MININNISHVYWACRRGILELDILIMFFFKSCFNYLDVNDKKNFVFLLKNSDVFILNLLLNINYSVDMNLKKIVSMIQNLNLSRKLPLI